MSPERALEGWLLLQEAYPERFLIMMIEGIHEGFPIMIMMKIEEEVDVGAGKSTAIIQMQMLMVRMSRKRFN